MIQRPLPIASLAAAATLALASPAAAAVDVCPDPSECDFTTIQEAVTAAAVGDTIDVAPGRYQETVQIRKRLRLRGAQAGADARTSRGGEESRVGAQNGGFVLEAGADGTEIDGFTIFRAGSSGGPSQFDAGVAVTTPLAALRIVNNIITDNVMGIQLNTTSASRSVVRRNALGNNNNDGGEGDEQGNGVYSDQSAANVLIERNNFTGHQNEAVLLKNGPMDVATGIDIIGNGLRDDSGIVVANARAVRVVENSSEGNVDDDVIDDDVIEMAGNVDGATIRDNNLRRYEGAGIAISSDVTPTTNKNISVIGNTLLGNRDVSTDRGVRLLGDTYEGRLDVAFNRIFKNDIGITNEDSDSGEQIKAENNWWGSNARPGTPPSDSVAGDVDVGPRLQMRVQANDSVKSGGRQVKVRASLQFNSASPAERFTPSDFPNGTTIKFETDKGTIEKRAETIDGIADAIFVSGNGSGKAHIRVKLDGEVLQDEIRVR